MSQERAADLSFLQSLYRYLLDEYNRLTILKADLERSIETLKALQRAQEDEVGPLIIPVSSFLSLLVEGAKAKEILILMGGNIFAKMSPEEALKQAQERLEEVNKSLSEVGLSLTKVQLEMESLQRGTGERAR
ncbi:MAG: hypothetical protein J7L91_02550 [Candidatus Korarchaeota archaeon]|nr:hypothetical protein [Candidatus Korarchaeota archaeon]